MSVVNKIVLTALQTVMEAVRDRLPSALASDRLKVDGSGVTQPVSDAGGSLTVDGGVTATQGTAAAANAPWYVRLSDGAAAVSVALDATVQAVRDRLPASLGLLAATSSLPVVFGRSIPATNTTLAINGEVIKASAGVALWVTISNTTGSSVYWQIHDLASGPPANGARAAASAPAITANNGSRAGDLIGPTLGLGCSTGILLVLSLSPTTYSAVASNSCSYSIQYI